MATIVSYNGSNFSIPANREPRGWGSSLTSFLLEVAEASLTPSGGNYRLQADLNLGSDGVTPSSFGLVALYYKSVTANIAQSGQLRLARADTIAWRSTTNTDLPLGVSASDRLQFDSVNIPTISSTDTLTNKTLTSPVINSPTGLVKADVGLGNVDNTSDANKPISTATQTALDLKANLVNPTFDDGVTMLHESTPSNPSSGRIRVYPKSDNRLYTLDSSGVETVVGSGAAGGFVNYITNPDAESSTTGWSTYADAAASTPADGTGGSPNVTWTRNTSSPIRGNADFAFAKDAANRQGQGVSFAFTLATTDRSKKCQISFDYDTSAANYAAGDMRVYVYDVTNATLITPQTVDIPRGTNTFVTTFDTTTSTSYRLILHVATTNATAYTVDFDNFVVNAGQVVQGAAISEYETVSTYAITGTTSNPTFGTITYLRTTSRDGEYAIIRWEGRQTTSGAAGTGDYLLPLPSGLTINYAKANALATSTSALGIVGSGRVDVGNSFSALPFVQNSGAYVNKVGVVLNNDTTNITAWGSSLGTFANSSVNFSITARIPIAEWAGSGTVNLGPGAQIEYLSHDGTSASTTWAQVPNIAGASGATSYTLTPQFPCQSDDVLELELRDSSNNVISNGAYPWIAGTSSFLFGLQARKQANGQIVVFFGNGGFSPTSGLGAAATGNTWADFRTGGWTWRVRKAKASSPVGFGLAGTDGSSGLYQAGRAPGLTTGATIASGMIGERITWTSAPSNQTLTTTMADWTNASITVPAGVWLVTANVQCLAESGNVASNFSTANVVITDASNNIVQEMDQQLLTRCQTASNVGVSVGTLAFSMLVNVNTSTTYKIRARRIDGAGTGQALVYNQSTNRSHFYAVRIA